MYIIIIDRSDLMGYEAKSEYINKILLKCLILIMLIGFISIVIFFIHSFIKSQNNIIEGLPLNKVINIYSEPKNNYHLKESKKNNLSIYSGKMVEDKGASYISIYGDPSKNTVTKISLKIRASSLVKTNFLNIAHAVYAIDNFTNSSDPFSVFHDNLEILNNDNNAVLGKVIGNTGMIMFYDKENQLVNIEFVAPKYINQ